MSARRDKRKTCTPVWYGEVQAAFLSAEARRVGTNRAAYIRAIVSKHINSDPEARQRWIAFEAAAIRGEHQ